MVDANGRAGGIWCFWDSARWKLEMLQFSTQFVHFAVSRGSLAWELTIIYANPHPHFRIGLKRELRRIAENIQNPWCILGDFNAVLKESECKGGSSSACLRGDNAFRDFVLECHLLDMCYQGEPFTGKRGSLFERLDCVLVSLEWKMANPNSNVFHLNPFKSDHCPSC
ncbi:uncharacterized protein LOC109807358 [Cajanus cajan]|uniref:uncharacterized protein LOC109807358 n=1 Tax=Cajanus cajan TaxID=3821 RepID=UPI00098DCD10|nr:uncharacterized protein LOC109807358 [Cajanus cajan]